MLKLDLDGARYSPPASPSSPASPASSTRGRRSPGRSKAKRASELYHTLTHKSSSRSRRTSDVSLPDPSLLDDGGGDSDGDSSDDESIQLLDAAQAAACVLRRRDELREASRFAKARGMGHARRRLADMEAKLLEKWGFSEDRDAFEENVAAVLKRHERVARRWVAAVDRIEGVSHAYERKVARVVAYARTEWLTRREWRIYLRGYYQVGADVGGSASETAAQRRKPVPRRTFFLSWLGALGAYALSFAYLLQRATAWGRRLTLVWIEDALFCVWFEYAVLETLRVLLTFVVLPMFLQHRMRSAEMRKMRRFPFSERFLDSPVARVLAARPDLARSKHLATRFYDRETVLDDLEAHGPVVERFVKARYSIFVVTAGTFLLIPEFMQDVVFAEVCDLLPYLTSKLLRGFIEFDSVGGRRQGSGAAVVSIALLAVLLSVFFAFNLMRWVDERILCTTTPTPDAALEDAPPEEGSLSPLPRLEIGPPEEAGADLIAAPHEVAPRDDAGAPAPSGDTEDVPDDGGDVVAAAEI
jgi:hypothetical protein